MRTMHNMNGNMGVEATPVSPGRVWYLVALLVFLAGAATAGWLVLHGVEEAQRDFSAERGEFRAPGRWTLDVVTPGPFGIFLVGQETAAPDMTLQVRRAATGQDVSVSASLSTSMRYTVNDVQWTPLATFTAAEPGEYEIVASAGAGVTGTVLLGVAPGDWFSRFFRKIVESVLVVLAVLLIGIVVPLIMAVVVFIRRHSAQPTDAQSTLSGQVPGSPPPPPSSPPQGDTGQAMGYGSQSVGGLGQPTHSEAQARMWGTLCHLSALVALSCIPFSNILGPLVVWLLKRHEYAVVEEQGREALNFQLSMTLYGMIAVLLVFVGVGLVLGPALLLLNLGLVIAGAVRVNNGQPWRYPLTLRIVR